MNLQSIQKRIEEMSAELLTLSNDFTHLLQGEVVRPALALPYDWADGLKSGDSVVCVELTENATETARRCFTVGKVYKVVHRLDGVDPDGWYYGVRIEKDDELEGHDANGVKFAKVRV